MQRFPNLTGQLAIYKTGSPDYVDVSAGAALSAMVTFSAKATDDGWVDGDEVGVRIRQVADPLSNYKVCSASWDETNEYLLLGDVEESVGTISDTDAVEVIAVLTTDMFDAVTQQARLVVITGTTHSVTAAQSGYLLRCTNASAVTVTLPDTLPVNFHCIVVQEGTGTVTVQTENTDTLNGTAAGSVTTVAQYSSIYAYQHSAGTWIALT